ncbi:hypothetical protein BDN72DRAFT_856799 [Pluteus cervinus]|uniref:Uncharacterized protein n=1 Tax=Pluteus cervinus TaxID=181527 RepID=A0ACD3B057_9AGAR|nr:hypothetical protein BDN72DRAFT_856799 [Pluteus cervinus]
MSANNQLNIGRRILSPRDLDVNNTQPSSSTASVSSSSSTAPRDPASDQLYITNALNSFSFGQPPVHSHSGSRPLNPLSPSADDTDDSPSAIADVTPRPSVAYPSGHVPPRSHPSQPPGDPPNINLLSNPAYISPRTNRPYQDDAASHRTFGFSSASASVTSFSSRDDSHAGSSRQASTTDNQISTTDDSDSEEDGHRHPIPQSLVTSSAQRLLHQSSYNSNAEYSSDEEYEDSDLDEYTDEEDVGMDIEISSAQFDPDCVAHSHEFDRVLYGGMGSHSSIRRAAIVSERRGSISTLGTLERRGSLPMAIPGAPSPDPQDTDYGYTSRDGNVATLRRGSKSLDQNELRLHSISERPLPPAPVSYPESEGDWRNLQEKHKGNGKARQGDPSSSSPSVVAGDPLSASTQGGPPPPDNPVMDGFDMGWGKFSQGMFAMDTADVADIINPGHPAQSTAGGGLTSDPNQTRRPSATKWISRLMKDPSNNRRPSTATTASIALGDSFGRAIGKWGGDEYRLQRRDWTFKRERADRPGGVDPSEFDSTRLSTEVPRTASAMRRTSLGGFLTPSQSITTEKSLSTQDYVDSLRALSEREKEREREREREERERERKAKAVAWRGMVLNQQEVWKNDLVGRFKVDRKATKPADPSKGPQQRLNVTHFRDGFSAPLPVNGPPVTIHKHSKAVAFSISRHYHLRQAPAHPPSSVGRSAATTGTAAIPTRSGRRPGSNETPATKKRASMILLAPRRVQEAFTSTTTTRKLEDHGLLSMLGVTQEQANASTAMRRQQQQQLHQRGERDRARDRGTSKDRREKGKGKEREKDRDREREKESQKERERNRIAAIAISQATVSGLSKKGKQPESRSQSSSAGSVSSSTKAASSSTSSFPNGATLAGNSSASSYQSVHVYPPAPSVRSSLPAPPVSAPLPIGLQLSNSSSSSTAAETSSSQHGDPPSSDHPLFRPSSRTRRRRRGGDPYDSLLDDDDDSDVPPPTRTPHSETYGTMDPASLEQRRANDRSHSDPDNAFPNKIVALFRGKAGHTNPPAPSNARFDAHYEPPWLVLASRSKQEQQQRVVDNLNSSFKDVGLLPSTHRDKSKTAKRKPKPEGRQSSTVPGAIQPVDIFEEVPGDSLYMLLPLWPGDTDPTHEKKLPAGYVRPRIACEDRQYLLVYYVPQGDADEPRSVGAITDGHESGGGRGRKEGGSGSKKKSKDSPTHSGETPSKREKEKDRKEKDRDPRDRGQHGHRRGDDRSILLTSFHISARLVSYRDLQGYGVRVPDEGLTVTGKLESAFDEMPQAIRERNRDKEKTSSMVTPAGIGGGLPFLSSLSPSYSPSSSTNFGTVSAPATSLSSSSTTALAQSRLVEQMDYVVGVCHSRDAGIEFFPEGLVKMGLCLVTPPTKEIIANAQAAAQAEKELALGGMNSEARDAIGPLNGPGLSEAEAFVPPEPVVSLTQIGRAVVEMAWLGGMALTSFGPGV